MTYHYHGLSALAEDLVDMVGMLGYHVLIGLAIGGAFMLACCFTPRIVRHWWMAGWERVFGPKDDAD